MSDDPSHAAACEAASFRDGRWTVAVEVVRAAFGSWHDHPPYTDLAEMIVEDPALGVKSAMDERDARKRAHVPRATFEGAPPIPMLLWCPSCCERHIDEGEFATKVHHTHACQYCGVVWRPAVVATVGVRFLPGFKNEEPK